jgi:dephospho-CoA kinase
MPVVICITGPPGSGKSTVASILRARGFRIVEMSAQIKGEMRARGLRITPASLERFAKELKRRRGRDVAARIVVGKLRGARGRIAITGVRSMEEVGAIRDGLGQALILSVVAKRDVRYNRLSTRRSFRVQSRSLFTEREESNLAMGLGNVMRSADFVIANSGTRRELRASVAEFIMALPKG